MSDADRAAALKFRPPVGTYSENTLVGVWRTQSKNGSIEHISRITKVQCPVCKEMLREWEDLPPPRCMNCFQWAEAHRVGLPVGNSPHPPVDYQRPVNYERLREVGKATAQAALEACTSKTAPIRIGTVVKSRGDGWVELEIDLSAQSRERLHDIGRFDGYIQRDPGSLHRAQPSLAAPGKQLEKECALRSFVAIQRENTAVLKQTKYERDLASAEWSAQLRLKVEAAKERDREAARYTPYWSPEEQSGGDL